MPEMLRYTGAVVSSALRPTLLIYRWDNWFGWQRLPGRSLFDLLPRAFDLRPGESKLPGTSISAEISWIFCSAVVIGV